MSKAIYSELKKTGSDLIPVAPAAHYTIGGVRTGMKGESSLRGLYCCGEVACTGVHGANRLASNSLLECIVFSKRAVEGAVDNLEYGTGGNNPVRSSSELTTLTNADDKDRKRFEICEDKLLNDTNAYLGIVRNTDGLERFENELSAVIGQSSELKGWFRFKMDTMIDVCRLMLNAAERRKESRGAHIREDYPSEDEKYRHHFVFRAGFNPEEVDI